MIRLVSAWVLVNGLLMTPGVALGRREGGERPRRSFHEGGKVTNRFGAGARLFHWLVVLLLLVQIPAGIAMIAPALEQGSIDRLFYPSQGARRRAARGRGGPGSVAADPPSTADVGGHPGARATHRDHGALGHLWGPGRDCGERIRARRRGMASPSR